MDWSSLFAYSLFLPSSDREVIQPTQHVFAPLFDMCLSPGTPSPWQVKNYGFQNLVRPFAAILTKCLPSCQIRATLPVTQLPPAIAHRTLTAVPLDVEKYFNGSPL